MRVIGVLLLAAALLGGAAPVAAQPIENELVLITPVGKSLSDPILAAFREHAKRRWNVDVRASALSAGTPVAFGTIVEWNRRPQADVVWGGEAGLFDKLASRKLLAPLGLANTVTDPVPLAIGAPKAVSLKDPKGYWIGTVLESTGIAYHPRLLKRLAANTGMFAARSRDVPSLVAKGEFAVGFAVPSYFAFEERLAGFDIRYVAPKTAWIQPGPAAILAGARHPKAARAFVEFMLSERGQAIAMERGLFPIVPRHCIQGLPGSRAELAVEFNGGVRSYFDAPVVSVYDDELAQRRYEQVDATYRREIEVPGIRAGH